LQKNKDEEDNVPRSKILLCGASLGLFLSIVGRFGFDLPIKMFKMSESSSWTVHPIAIVLYMIIFLYVEKIIK